MRLVIHAAGITGGGGLRHLGGLMPALARGLERDDRALVLVRGTVASTLVGADRVEIASVPDAWGGVPLARGALDQLYVPHLCRRFDADVLVSFANFGPLKAPCPHVVLHTNALFHETHVGRARALGTSSVMRPATIAEQGTLELRTVASLATLRGARAIVVPSEAMAADFTALHPALAGRVKVVRHGVEPELFRALPRTSGAAPFTFVSPALGAFYKGLDVLVPAIAQVEGLVRVRALARTADWPDGVAAARAHATKLGLGDRLVFEEEVEQASMATVYGDADALVYPTRCESFGFTLLEALCAGLPVVASDLPVNREIAGDAALYYDVDSPEALAAAMRRLIDDEALRAQLVAAARARIAGRDWSWERNARELLAVCRGVAR